MNSIKIVAVVAVFTTLLTACYEAPFDTTVENLIKTQYEQAGTETNEVMAIANKDKTNEAFNNVIQSAMPVLDSVDNIDCEAISAGENDEGNNSYLCSADITQTMNGHTSTNQGSFKVYKADGEWALGL